MNKNDIWGLLELISAQSQYAVFPEMSDDFPFQQCTVNSGKRPWIPLEKAGRKIVSINIW